MTNFEEMTHPLPSRVHPTVEAHWDAIADELYDVLAVYDPPGKRSFSHARWLAARFLGWAAHRQLPLDRERLWTPDRVEEFCADTSPHGSGGISDLGSVRSRLKHIGVAVTKTAPWPERAEYERRALAEGYGERQMSFIARAVTHHPEPWTRYICLLAVGLCRGVGARPDEIVLATADQFVTSPGGRPAWAFEDRTVVFTEPWDTFVAEALEQTDQFKVLTPGGPLIGANRGQNFVRNKLQELSLPESLNLVQGRLRTTWLTSLVYGLGVSDVLRAAGLKSMNSLRDLLPHDDDTLPCDATEQLLAGVAPVYQSPPPPDDEVDEEDVFEAGADQ